MPPKKGENDSNTDKNFDLKSLSDTLSKINEKVDSLGTIVTALAKKEDTEDEQPDPLKVYNDVIRKLLGEKMDAKTLEAIKDEELLVAAKLAPKTDSEGKENKHPADRTQTTTKNSGLPWWLTQHVEGAAK
jgi:hypothetical protein